MKYILLLFITLPILQLQAHGVSHTLLQDAYGAQLLYEDGSPLEFADVQIFRPGETDMEFQVGMTDENGVFMFRPDTTGVWILKASDGLGHGKVIKINITRMHATLMQPDHLSRWQKVISGIGYILFSFSIWSYFTQRRKNKHAHS